MRTLRAWQTAVAFAVLAASEATAGKPAATVQIEVHVVADARVPREVLERAKPEAARIYQQIGIAVIWVDEANMRSITMRVIDGTIKEAGGSAMGVAPRGRGEVGRLLYAFYSRVEAFAHQHEKPIAQVLGHVMAHELGHLLLPHGSHSNKGIMVARWDRAQIEEIGRGWLSFTSEETEAMRERARTLEIGR
jgi:hypothetical protein